MADIIENRLYAGPESLQKLMQVIGAGDVLVNPDSATPTIGSYAIAGLKEYPEFIQKTPGFPELLQQLEDLDAAQLAKSEYDSTAIWNGDVGGLELYQRKLRGKQIEEAAKILQEQDMPVIFHYGIEDATTKIASAYQRLDGQKLPREDDVVKAINRLFHYWLEEHNLIRQGDAVYIKNTNELADTAELRDLIKDQEKGFATYLKEVEVDKILPFERQYQITPVSKPEKAVEVEVAPELSAEEKAQQQKGMGG